jgi:peptide/nickel transport system ATP-binding protein
MAAARLLHLAITDSRQRRAAEEQKMTLPLQTASNVAKAASQALVSVRNLNVEFVNDEGRHPVVRNVSFDVEPGKCLGIVGESGSGKSVTSLAIMGLLPPPPYSNVAGEVMFEGRDLRKLDPEEMRKMRGSQVSMIFQEPMTSLNPAFTIGDQVMEAVRTHENVTERAARARALEILREVRIPAPERRLDEYPHRLSGGMRQRVMIAIAIACRPRLLIADEPTTALDVTIQAQILDLLRRLQDEYGVALLMISHNFGVIAEIADDVAVMYAGRIVERGPIKQVFHAPEHPYTVGLLGATPRGGDRKSRLASIEGNVPDLRTVLTKCGFAARCPFVEEPCTANEQPLRSVAPTHDTACRRAPLEQIA